MDQIFERDEAFAQRKRSCQKERDEEKWKKSTEYRINSATVSGVRFRKYSISPGLFLKFD